MKNTSPILKYVLLILAFFVQTSFADQAKVKLSLISESKTVGNETTLNLGLRAKIIPGWKTYWRSPGVAGYGVTFTWDGSRNVKSVQLLWPIPHRSQTQMGQVNAYDGDVVFPLKVEVVDPAKPIHLNLNVDMLVCDVGNCLPVMETINLDLPSGSKTESAEAALIREAFKNLPERKIPETHDFGSFQIQRVALQGADEIPPTLQVVLSKESGSFSEGDLPEVYLEIKDKLVDAPVVTLSKDRKSVRYSAAIYPDSNRVPTLLTNLIGNPVTLTIKYQNELLEVDQTLKMQQLSFGLLAAMLLAAFIGGLILNIMPCVLPVLSLKVLSVMRHGGGNNAVVRHEFLATVLGILFSFLVLAGGAIFLKLSGEAVGWGVQFQEPHFLIALVGILTLFACNLFGFFEFRLPPFLSTLGGITPKRESWVGSFLEGSLVTALATPCTAPFLGTALAFALSRGIYEIL
jgi:suppressor for copper-sensitivity B